MNSQRSHEMVFGFYLLRVFDTFIHLVVVYCVSYAEYMCSWRIVSYMNFLFYQNSPYEKYLYILFNDILSDTFIFNYMKKRIYKIERYFAIRLEDVINHVVFFCFSPFSGWLHSIWCWFIVRVPDTQIKSVWFNVQCISLIHLFYFYNNILKTNIEKSA